MSIKNQHWATLLRNSTDLEDTWAYRVACYWQGVSELKARQAAKLCITLPCCVWHAVSVLTDRLDTCHCAQCEKARGEPPLRI